ncbi:bifunctional glycosyltransferase/CDP-glycerol:glycerophosphate glycerophosphotransferase [Nocardioides insulae]|uniref:bifunctional glycosyltransferase/CDP-glycerol:glycerophosphate glycerophosphotransferase n=1 Tax=Nocardioides insulae TaxID=394734 RepID=UPI000425F125|nr:CDP-glycerol glycerophosphotransferase family protein [Nocardioides insulae]
MRVGSQVKRLVDQVARSRRRALPDSGRVDREQPQAPTVSVIVTGSDADLAWIHEALTSARGQTHDDLEILFVPYGACAEVTRLVGRSCAEDQRVTVAGEVVGDRDLARGWGARHARGTYLCFLSGDDVLPPKGIALGVASLEESGSDLAVGKVGRTGSASRTQDRVHSTRLRGTSLSEFPALAADTALGNRLFRTEFWRSSGLAFGGDADDASAVALGALVRARSVDVLVGRTYLDKERRSATPVGYQHDTTGQLAAWVDGVNGALTEAARTSPGAQEHWSVEVLGNQLPRFLADTERFSQEQWTQLREVGSALAELLSDDGWLRIPSEPRVRLSLLLADRREDLVDFHIRRFHERGAVRTRVRGGVVHAQYPFCDDATGLAPVRFVLGPEETPGRLRLVDVRSRPDLLELDLIARIDFVDMAGTAPRIEVHLVHQDGHVVDLPVRSRLDPATNHIFGHRYQDYGPGACTVEVDLASLKSGTWRLETSITVQGVSRTTSAVSLEGRSPAGRLGTRDQPVRHTAAGDSVRMHRVDTDGLGFTVAPGNGVLPALATVEGRTLHFRFSPDAGVSSVRADRGGQSVEADVTDSGDVRVELPSAPMATTSAWTLTALVGGKTRSIAWREGGSEQWAAGGAGVLLTRTAAGTSEALELAEAAAVDRVRLGADTMTVEGRWIGTTPLAARMVLHGARHRQEVSMETLPEGGFSATFDTRRDLWGLGPSAIPTGQYDFHLLSADSDRPVLPSGEFIRGLLDYRVGDEFRLRQRFSPDGAVGVELGPPVAIDVAAPYEQNLLREQLRDSTAPIDEQSAYFVVYGGATATDSQLEIYRELRRTRPEITVYWGIADHSSRVPEGSIAVIIESPEWFDVMARVGYIVSNDNFPWWWRKRPGQRFLQTFHGYPAKTMGLRMWRAKQFTPRRLEMALDQTMRGWDLIVTPVPEMDTYYRAEYAYDGPIHHEGYPRDDALVLPSAAEIRTRTRERLGIGPGQKVVLYAPTWRDDLAKSYTEAASVEHLDVESASRELGENYVFLMRGHRYHAGAGERSAKSAALIDVTHYPEINDLILASDAAVLDYSSLRFDFALTERPMVFLVPDLADYTGGVRGFLFDFADTAPGPMVGSTEEAVEALSDLASLQAGYAERIKDFNAKFQYFHDGHAAERLVARFFGGDS